jgi:O-antigen/teichoic acid export membrane protein
MRGAGSRGWAGGEPCGAGLHSPRGGSRCDAVDDEVVIPDVVDVSTERHSRRRRSIRGRVTHQSPELDGNLRGHAVGRVTLTTVDQGLSSLSNFAVGVVVGRISGPAGLGAFAVAYAAWLLLATLHRSLIIEPMSIDGDARHPLASRLLGSGASAEIMLGAVSTAILAIGGLVLLGRDRTYGLALLTLAPFLIPLLLQDYWRWVGFMQARPGKALANDTLFNVVQVVVLGALFVAGLRSVEIAIVAWGIGAIAGSAFGLWQFRVHRFTRGGMSLFRSRWHMSKWLTANGVTSWGTSQSYPLLAGGILGPAGIGGLRAAQGLVMGPANVLLQAGGSIGLPDASKAWDERGWSGLRRVSNVVLIAGVISLGSVAVVVLLAGKTLLSTLYGPEFATYGTAADLFALCCLIQIFGLGAILVLKTTNQPRTLFHIGLLALAVTSVSVVVLSYAWGVNGAAVATVFAGIATLVGLSRAYRRTALSYNASRSGAQSVNNTRDGGDERTPMQPRSDGRTEVQVAAPPRPRAGRVSRDSAALEEVRLGSAAWANAATALRGRDGRRAIDLLRVAAAHFGSAATTTGAADPSDLPATPHDDCATAFVPSQEIGAPGDSPVSELIFEGARRRREPEAAQSVLETLLPQETQPN